MYDENIYRYTSKDYVRQKLGVGFYVMLINYYSSWKIFAEFTVPTNPTIDGHVGYTDYVLDLINDNNVYIKMEARIMNDGAKYKCPVYIKTWDKEGNEITNAQNLKNTDKEV